MLSFIFNYNLNKLYTPQLLELELPNQIRME